MLLPISPRRAFGIGLLPGDDVPVFGLHTGVQDDCWVHMIWFAGLQLVYINDKK